MKSVFLISFLFIGSNVFAQGAANTAAAPTAPSPAAYQNESQAAIVQTSGNTETESLSLKQLSTYTHNKDTGKVSGSYLKTSTDNTDTALKWDAGLRYERLLSERFSGYVGYSVESDRFAGYVQRNNADIGGKYQIVKSEKYDALSELGYRHTDEDVAHVERDSHYSSIRVYLENTYRINETNSAKLWVEYLPNLDHSEDYQVKSEASISSAINTMFSLKVAYLWSFDNEPGVNDAGAANYRTDTTLTTALVAKF